MKILDKITLKSGKEIEIFNNISDSSNAKNILIIGVFHGEEPQGYWAIKDYFFKRSSCNIKNNIFIIPCLNPDGMNKNCRQNANGVDLNRNFSTNNWQKTDSNSEYFGGNSPASEAETKFLIKWIDKIKPDFILTLHSPFAIVNYDGDATYVANEISSLTGYPVKADIGYPTPGSFGTYCGIERHIPTVTLEFDENESKESIINKGRKVFEYLERVY